MRSSSIDRCSIGARFVPKLIYPSKLSVDVVNLTRPFSYSLAHEHRARAIRAHHETAATYSVGKEGLNILGLFLCNCFVAEIHACALCIGKVRDVKLGLHAISSPCVLYSFTMIILGLESSS